MEWTRLREKLLDRYSASEQELEELEKKYREISEFIQQKHGLETHFAGSASRGTCLGGDKDIDVFVLFPEDVEREDLEDRGLDIGRQVFEQFNADYQVNYAEHPYTMGEIDGHEVEIVPCYDVGPEDIQSSVDRTPHHSSWVKENLDSDQRDDVVLLKAFLRAQGLYGSSLRVQGFSGYLCEVLVAEYGGLRQLAQAAVDWSRKEVIDPENHHGGELPEMLEEKFQNDSLVVIDPVDPERNVASVLSGENYARFVHSCWEFERKPGMDSFSLEEDEHTEFEVEQEMKRRADFLTVEFERPEGVEDVVYPQLRKTERAISRELEDAGFRLYGSGFHVEEGNARLLFELDRRLPEMEEVEGPQVFHNSEHLEQFRSKYDRVYVSGERLCAIQQREYTDAKQLLSDLLDADPRSKGVPERVCEAMEGFRFVDPMDGSDQWLNFLAEKLNL